MESCFSFNREPGNRRVFPSNTEGEEGVYRIPALLCDKNTKTLLAFAGKRSDSDDSSSVALVMRKGTVMKEGNSVNVLETLEGGYRPMNPCPVYEKKSNTIFLFFIGVEGKVSEQKQIRSGVNKTRLYYMTSADGGNSWSTVTYLTEHLPEIKTWSTFAVGGRLIVPAYAYAQCSSCQACPAKKTRSCCPPPKAFSVYSDDGENFSLGDMMGDESLECEMAEFCDVEGNRFVYCNARSGGGCRVEGVSEDDGKSFILLNSALVETGYGCQGSVVSFPAQPEGAGPAQGEWLLYSNPTSKSKRVDLGVYLNKSPKDQNAWRKPWILNPGPSGYSDLAYLDDGWFACLMERGEKSEIEEIACVCFSYDNLKKAGGQMKVTANEYLL
uniref:exo-alpha-sialidase n=1 Tax=Nothobranchius furzeri TaxID=105023 RepID=A0A8C6LD41_NOTFU